MTDDLQWYENEGSLVDAAMRLARRVSRALGAQRGRRPSSEAERAAILREAFEQAAGAELPGPVPAAPKTKEASEQADLVLRAGWRQNDAGRLEIEWCLAPRVPDAEALLNKYVTLRMRRRVQPRRIRSRKPDNGRYEPASRASRADDWSAPRGK
jgi:hypothetical protein